MGVAYECVYVYSIRYVSMWFAHVVYYACGLCTYRCASIFVAYLQILHESCLIPVCYLPSTVHSSLAAMGQVGKVTLNPRGEKEGGRWKVKTIQSSAVFRQRERDRSGARSILVSNMSQ